MTRDVLRMSLQDRKLDLILRMYLDTADQDYLSARAAYENCLFNVFYWNAAQACEKYIKGFLLLQNHPVIDQRHRLMELFLEMKRYDDDGVIPDLIDLPNTTAMGRDAWQGKDTSLYIDYLEVYGSPDNRYATTGTFINGPVLHALDRLFYFIRCLIKRKNFTGEDLFEYQNRNIGYHERIASPQIWMIDPTLLLEMLYAGRSPVGNGRTLLRSFHNMNFAFFGDEHEGERTFGGQYFIGSPLYNHLVRLPGSEGNRATEEEIVLLREWVGQHIRLSPIVRDRLGLPKRKR